MLRLGFVVAPGFQVMGFGALSVFEFANFSAGGPFYDVHLLSESGSAICSSLGVSVHTDAFDDSHFDTIIIGGATGLAAPSPALIAFVQNAMLRSRRVASVCTGAFVLAEAGVLDGRRATTHWAHARELQKRYPAVKVEEDRICQRRLNSPQKRANEISPPCRSAGLGYGTATVSAGTFGGRPRRLGCAPGCGPGGGAGGSRSACWRMR